MICDKYMCPKCIWHNGVDCQLPNLCVNLNKFIERKQKKPLIKRAHWIREKHSKITVYNPVWDLDTVKYRCSHCRKLSLLHAGYLYDFCPWCGSDMRGNENG